MITSRIVPNHAIGTLSRLVASHAPIGRHDVLAGLADLTAHVSDLIPSFVGLHLLTAASGQPVTVAVFEPPLGAGPVLASAFMALVVGAGSVSSASGFRTGVCLFASLRGAFDDVPERVGVDPLGRPGSRHPALPGFDTLDWTSTELDTRLPPAHTITGVYGLEELDAISRAVGVLIGRGHHPDQAFAAFQDEAGAAGVDGVAYARRLLSELPGSAARRHGARTSVGDRADRTRGSDRSWPDFVSDLRTPAPR